MRKQLKKQARSRMKKCYWLLVILCLIMAVTKIDYSESFTTYSTDTSQGVEESIETTVLKNLITGKEAAGSKAAQEFIEKQKNMTNNIGIIAIGHSRGVLSQIVNGVSSADYFNTLYHVLKNTTNSKSISIAGMILLSLLFMVFVHVFVFNIFKVSIKRVVMELRIYDKIPLNRFLYLLRVKQTINVAKTLLLNSIYYFFWCLVPGMAFVKSRSYRLVPYIMAENPAIKPKQAITLSRKMMDGHKWEAFKLDLSFLGWDILSFFTYGLTAFLFSNPYIELTNAEYYNYVRTCAKEANIPDVDLLNDEYLYTKADPEMLKEIYHDVQQYLAEADEPVVKHTGFRGFMENIFGLTFFYDEDEAKYQKLKVKQQATSDFKQVMELNMYPFRLFALKHKDHLVKFSSLQYDRHYSIFSVILIFFSLSFVGWAWEVSLHLVSDGKFVNRGILHGPWLPIYGFGCVLILIILNKFRAKPFVEFIAGIILCGCIEYFTAWFLETTHGGTKWWDYTGYFLNIHGRICAEGLLIFGLGGLAIVYLLAPFLDNHLRKIPNKILIIVTVILMVIYIGDTVYSSKHPNKGEGITDYTGYVIQLDSTIET